MSRILEELLHLLKLETVGDDVFVGQSQDLGWGRVYGGQVLGQALSAAERTIDSNRLAHSFHSYFLRPGNPAESIEYRVERTRDGRSFSTRRIRAEQGGRPIFFMAASFQNPEVGLEHQDAAPEVPGPEGIEPELTVAMKIADRIPESIREKILCKKPIEIRPVAPINPFAPDRRKP